MRSTTIVELIVMMVRWIIQQLCAILSWCLSFLGLRDTKHENLHCTSSMLMKGKHAASQQQRTAGRTHAGATVTPTPPTRGDVPTAWRTHGIAKQSKQQAGGLALRRRQHEATSFTCMYEYKHVSIDMMRELRRRQHEATSFTVCVCIHVYKTNTSTHKDMHTCLQDDTRTF